MSEIDGAAYVEMLPPDRPIHMIGQPIIKLVADGGPGGDLGDLGRRRRRRRGPWSYAPAYPTVPYYVPTPYYAPAPAPVMPVDVTGSMATPSDIEAASSVQTMGQAPQPGRRKGPRKSQRNLFERIWRGIARMFGSASPRMGQYDSRLQAELTAVAAGSAPDVSAEYFKPKAIPGLTSEFEGPHTSREGVYPKKLRDMVEYDMSGSTFVSPAALSDALGCCGSDNMGEGVAVTDIIRGRGVDAGGSIGEFGRPFATGDMGQFVSPNQVKETDFVRQGGVDAGAAIGEFGRPFSGMGQNPAPNAVALFPGGGSQWAAGVNAGGDYMGQFISPNQVREEPGNGGSGMGQFVAVTDLIRGHGVDAGAAIGEWGQPFSTMGQITPGDEAKLLEGRCDGIEKKAKEIVAAVYKANADASLSRAQKVQAAVEARKMLHALKREWKRCRNRIKSIVNHFKASGDLKKFGLADVDAKIVKDEKLAKCRAKLTAIREIACRKRNAGTSGMGEPWNGRPERGSWNH